MLDQLQPLQGTSYELPSLREKVTAENLSLILHGSPILTCGIPLPSDISYNGYRTSSHKVKVLWCLILFLINVYDFLTCATTTFPQTITNCRIAGPVSLGFYWWEWSKSYLCRMSTPLCDFYHDGIFFNINGVSVLTFKTSWAPHAVARACTTQPVFLPTHSCVRWHQAAAERGSARLLLNSEKRELSCRNRVITVHGVTFSN